MQTKFKGGINLHDIQTKINTFRLTHIGIIISQPHSHRLAHYYICIQLNKLTKLNNQTPHYLHYSTQNAYKGKNLVKTLDIFIVSAANQSNARLRRVLVGGWRHDDVTRRVNTAFLELKSAEKAIFFSL